MRPSSPFVAELANYLRGKTVLEVFAGYGYLAGLLAQHDINIRATTRFSSYGGHEHGLFQDVEDLDAECAVALYAASADVLLMTWPTTTAAVLRAAPLWGPFKPMVYVGEVTDRSRNHLAGCATDEFFEALQHGRKFKSYAGSQAEAAMECFIKSE